MTVQLILSRHAQYYSTYANRDAAPLTGEGKKTALMTGFVMRKSAQGLQMVYHSPAQRAIQTAKLMAAGYTGIAGYFKHAAHAEPEDELPIPDMKLPINALSCLQIPKGDEAQSCFDDLSAALKSLPGDVSSVLCVTHEPVIEEILGRILPRAGEDYRKTLSHTLGYVRPAVLQWDSGWESIGQVPPRKAGLVTPQLTASMIRDNPKDIEGLATLLEQLEL